jgi:hypothetical protein
MGTMQMHKKGNPEKRESERKKHTLIKGVLRALLLCTFVPSGLLDGRSQSLKYTIVIYYILKI